MEKEIVFIYLIELIGRIWRIGVIGIIGIIGTLRLSEGRVCLQTMPSMSNEKTAKQD